MNITVSANPCFREVDRSDKRYIVMKGSAGSGKSVDTAQHYILRLMNDPGRNLACIRKSDITNRDSTFAELTGAIYRMFGNQADRYWKITTSPLQIVCRHNGNRVIFRGMNDDKQREKLKSITFQRGKLTDVWMEEATEFSQADLEIIDDRLRGELPEGQFYQIRMTFNPVSKSHWIKKVFFDIADPHVLTHHSTFEMNRFIDDAYRARMERRKFVDPEGYLIYGLGEWGEVGGLILSNYVVEEFDTDPACFDYMVNAQDFGYNHANALGEIGFKDGELFLCKELYVFEKDTSEIIQMANAKGFRKDVTMWCDSAEPDRIKMWRKAGYKALPVKKEPNSVKAQIDHLKQMKIHIHPSCVNTLKEIQQWKWRKDEKTNTYTDEPVPFQDDAMAMLRYSIEQERRARPTLNTSIKGGL